MNVNDSSFRTAMVYPINFGSFLPASGQLNSSFIVRKNEAFLWHQGRAVVYTGQTEPNTFADVIQSAQPVPPITVLLQDTVSGEQLTNVPVPLGAFFGIGLKPVEFVTPRFFDELTQLTVTLQNLDAAHDYLVRLAFIGQAIYGTS
jgi:hypothetical protein